ncbi:MAG: methionyl-tRNA formyltransferase [Parcubacteria group bacterium Licking1014_17]|nr:MAG: methionyl-tRNA formyltransferase [Parcubacteria group bacterium Licking1014_17]
MPALKKLRESGYKILAVITAPDKPVGREKTITPPPVKITAQELGLKILQPPKLRGNSQFWDELKSLGDIGLGVVAAYGKIIPEEILELPKFGLLNIHPSLLPKYRGASPIQAVLSNGETETGVTIMKLDKEMDHGPILAQKKVEIKPNEKYPELSERLSEIGSDMLIDILPDYFAGKIKPAEQNHSSATLTKIIKKEDGKADWSLGANWLYNTYRAFYPWPGLWTEWEGKILKIIECSPDDAVITAKADTGALAIDGGKLGFICGKGFLIVKSLQRAGEKILSDSQFIQGYGKLIKKIP